MPSKYVWAVGRGPALGLGADVCFIWHPTSKPDVVTVASAGPLLTERVAAFRAAPAGLVQLLASTTAAGGLGPAIDSRANGAHDALIVGQDSVACNGCVAFVAKSASPPPKGSTPVTLRVGSTWLMLNVLSSVPCGCDSET